MKLELKENYPVLNDNIINIKEIAPNLFTNLLNSNPRIVKLDMGISIHIFDRFGIRFWERNNKVYEAEFLLEKSSDEKCSQLTFNGEIVLDNITLSLPISIETIKSITTIRTMQDDDSLRFGMNIYHIFLTNRKYSFWVAENNETVTAIHI
jgi:hypothetical protein